MTMDGIATLIDQRREAGLYRELQPCEFRAAGRIVRGGREYLDFCSNDYLALSSHAALTSAAQEAALRFGTSASASRLLSGDLSLCHELEARVAALKGKPAALVYNSGYHANLGVLSALCGPADLVLCDRLSHASILDGVKLAGARLLRFRHNDVDHLQSLLQKKGKRFERIFVVTESVFSMDGDLAPLAEMAVLKRRQPFTLIVDEAHATGVFGPNGAGLVNQLNLQDDVDLIVGTFSKALGSFGAYAACSRELRDFLVNYSRSFIYSTALPPPVLAANLAALELLDREPHRRESLLRRSAWFRQQLAQIGLPTHSQSQIAPVVVGPVDEAVRCSRELANTGIWTLPIRPPTVPAGAARLRFCLTCGHQPEDLERTIECLHRVAHV
jgi:8-amino-7-oxononanoate synthase